MVSRLALDGAGRMAAPRQTPYHHGMRIRSLAAVLGLACAGSSMGGPAKPSVVADDPGAFAKVIALDAKLEKVRGGFGFLEGTVWMPDGYLLFSDEGEGRSQIFKWSEKEGVTEFRHPSNMTNGNAVDRQGRLISCEQDIRAVTRTEADGSRTTLVDRCDGKRFNSPNDVVVKSDGTIWFSDPAYGLPKGEQKEYAGNHVFRFDPATKRVTAVVTDMAWPNGLAFGPDEKTLYVSDTGRDRFIRAFDVRADGTLGAGRVVCRTDKGAPDGFRIDGDGRIWTSAGDGVHVFTPDGKRIGKILVPESPANLCFGGADGRTLFIAARTGLYRIRVNVTAAHER